MLEAVLEAIDERALSDPRLERYRVAGRGPSALDGLPAGWFVSDSIARIATVGGWWPGEWTFPTDDGIVMLVVSGTRPLDGEPDVRWLGVGTVWERDGFWTPALGQRSPTAPLFGFSNQALWSSMVFPTEVAMLEAFAVTYDELGLDENGEINPFFVEWITRPPGPHEPAGAERVHERLGTLARQWTTDHRCWVPSAMPRLDHALWPPELVLAMLGAPLAG